MRSDYLKPGSSVFSTEKGAADFLKKHFPAVIFPLRTVTLASPAEEVLREAEGSPVSRGRPAHLDHGACRGTGVHAESEGLRDLL